jgi:Secretion system C-terminal sorting domain
MRNHLAILFLFAIFGVNGVDAQTVSEIAPDRFVISVNDQAVSTPSMSTHDLEQVHPEITRAIILHPTGPRELPTLFDILVESAEMDGSTDHLMIVGLQFLHLNDILVHGLQEENELLYWENHMWQRGDESTTSDIIPRTEFVSSFTFTDSISHHLAEICPNLAVLIVSGTSAGGGYVQRYAIGSDVVEELAPQTPVCFLTLSAHQLMYLSPDRPSRGSIERFRVPHQWVQDLCTTYDLYPYGMQDPNSYMDRHSQQFLTERFTSRRIAYLIGDRDTEVEQVPCPVLVQGVNRYKRNLAYFNYLRFFYGSIPLRYQESAVMPGVAHDFKDAFRSEVGSDYLFHWNPYQPVIDLARPCSNPVSEVADLSHEIEVSAYPNPFNECSTVTVHLTQDTELSVHAYDITGRRVASLANGFFPSGRHNLTFNGNYLTSGLYFIQTFASGHNAKVLKVMLVR